MKSKDLALCRLLFFFSLTLEYGRSVRRNKTLTVGGFYASGAKMTFQNASGILTIVKRAIEDINQHPDLLADYKLEIEWQDTKVNGLRTLSGLDCV